MRADRRNTLAAGTVSDVTHSTMRSRPRRRDSGRRACEVCGRDGARVSAELAGWARVLCTYHAWELATHPGSRTGWTAWARGRYIALLNSGHRELSAIIDCAATGSACPPSVMCAVLRCIPPQWLEAATPGEVEINRLEAMWLVEGPRLYALRHLATRESLSKCSMGDLEPSLRSASPLVREAALRALALLPRA